MIFQNVIIFSQSCDTVNLTMIFTYDVWQQHALHTFFSIDLKHLIKWFLSICSIIIPYNFTKDHPHYIHTDHTTLIL